MENNTSSTPGEDQSGPGPVTETKKESFFGKIHNPGFTWRDSIFTAIVLAFLFTMVFAGITAIPVKIILDLILPESDFAAAFSSYMEMISLWITVLPYIALTKYNRPILRALWTEAKGNTVKMFMLGLLTGFLQNTFCIVIALLHKDIYLSFDSLHLPEMLALLLAVFVQSSAEELICRGLIYQRLRKGYRSPWIAIIGNSAIFSLLHLFNSGVTALSLLNIFIVGVFYSLIVYYFDSIWFPMAAHTAWNYTQNLIFGLPNSGLVSPFSVMKLEAGTARNSFAYNVGFGVEGTLLACIVLGVSSLLAVYLGRKHNQPSLDIWA